MTEDGLSRLKALAAEIAAGQGAAARLVPLPVTRVLDEAQRASGQPADRVRELFFYCRHQFLLPPEAGPAPALQFSEFDGALRQAVNRDGPILGSQDPWKPGVRDLRAALEAAAEGRRVIVAEAGKAGNQFAVTLLPPGPDAPEGLKVELFTTLRAHTRTDAYLSVPGWFNRASLTALFGDVRDPLLHAPEDAARWARDHLAYAEAVFDWWMA